MKFTFEPGATISRGSQTIEFDSSGTYETDDREEIRWLSGLPHVEAEAAAGPEPAAEKKGGGARSSRTS
jgi:hypothetical protein